MDIAGTGRRVRIYIDEQDRAAGRSEPLWETILNFLRLEGAAGATVVRGLAGFGAHHKLHTARLADVAPNLPVLVEWLDGPERIERLLPRVCDLVREGTITVENVDVVKYTHRAPLDVPAERVGHVMTRDVIGVSPTTPVGEVVRLLLERRFRSVPVTDERNVLVGIITNRDLIERGGLSARIELLGELERSALERELASSGVRARTAADVMSGEVVSVAADTSLKDAAHLMVERGLKRLPVLDDGGSLLGIVSRADILRTMGETYASPRSEPSGAESREAPARTVGELTRRDVPSVRADASLGEVLDAVTSTRLNRAIVVDDQRRVLGIVTDADVLARLDPGAETGLLDVLMRRGKGSPRSTWQARDVMRAPALVATVETPLAEAVSRMLHARHKVLPVVDVEGRLVGAADRADLLAALWS